MAARTLDGLGMARDIRAEIKAEVESICRHGRPPCLGVVLVGDDPASHVYVRNKGRACEEVGITAVEQRLPAHADEARVLAAIDRYNRDSGVDGILVQLPLPRGMKKFPVLDAIDPAKDVDVFTPVNTGRLVQNRPAMKPCTPQAVVEILHRSGTPVAGQRVAIVNRSLVVGQPLASMLLQDNEFANATVTVCHEYTRDMVDILRAADIVVTAVGNRDRFTLTGEMVKPGATVIDVAIIRTETGLVGDADRSVWDVAGAVSPVPGGVGPLTIAMLLRNTVTAYHHEAGTNWMGPNS